MLGDDEALPSDQEDSNLKPRKPKDGKPTPPPDDEKAEEDASEQPS